MMIVLQVQVSKLNVQSVDISFLLAAYKGKSASFDIVLSDIESDLSGIALNVSRH